MFFFHPCSQQSSLSTKSQYPISHFNQKHILELLEIDFRFNNTIFKNIYDLTIQMNKAFLFDFCHFII